MAVHKALGRLVGADGQALGEGRAYVHLRLPAEQTQRAQGTLSLDWWDENGTFDSPRLELQDGPVLQLEVVSNKLSECVVGRILRYWAEWPGAG
jgi:hypothetical protein